MIILLILAILAAVAFVASFRIFTTESKRKRALLISTSVYLATLPIYLYNTVVNYPFRSYHSIKTDTLVSIVIFAILLFIGRRISKPIKPVEPDEPYR